MTCDGDNLRLLMVLVELAQQLRGLKAVHDGHGQVHQNECIGIIVFKALLGHLYADLAVVGGVNQLNNTWESAKCFHHHFEPNLVEHLVIDDQDATLLMIRKLAGRAVVHVVFGASPLGEQTCQLKVRLCRDRRSLSLTYLDFLKTGSAQVCDAAELGERTLAVNV